MAETVHPQVQPAWRVPEPAPLCTDEPFVGNESVDDNLAELAKIAIWNALHGRCASVSVSVADRVVHIEGVVADTDECRRCEEAVGAIHGVAGVVNRLCAAEP